MKEFVEKLIEKLEENTIQHKEAVNLFNYYGIKFVSASKAKEIVNQLAEEYKGGWIPVEQRLPSEKEYQECNGQFIVSDGNRTYATYFDIYDTLKFGEPTLSGFRVDRCVIAWQPLPEPYQPKGE